MRHPVLRFLGGRYQIDCRITTLDYGVSYGFQKVQELCIFFCIHTYFADYFDVNVAQLKSVSFLMLGLLLPFPSRRSSCGRVQLLH